MKMPKGTALDPKGLIADAYKIEGITLEECRSIFLDWALSYDGDTRAVLPQLIAEMGVADHPMTAVLREGEVAADRPKRRGGWRAKARG